MKDAVFIFLVIYGIIGVLIFIGGKIQYWKETNFLKNANNQDTIQLSELTVIIPFRNERSRIEPLLQSINACAKLPNQFIFVDDHSTDDTTSFLKSVLKIDNYCVLSASESGKKSAINQAIQATKTKDVLTLDSDVRFLPEFFAKLENLQRRDMLILPVLMRGKNWKRIFEIDVDFANAVNYGISGLIKPVLASGANLFFSKEKYLELNDLEKHKHMASGDDLFLLTNFKKNGCSIQLVTDKNVAVVTSTPNDFNEYFQQRLRWISKTTALKDPLSTFLAVIQLLFTSTFFLLLILLLIETESQLIIYLVFFKLMIDFSSTMTYYFHIGKIHNLIPIAIHQIWTPVFSIILAFGMLFYKPSWKGRKI